MKLVGESATQALGVKIANLCAPPLVIHLIGDLGSGKTTFARGFIQSFGHTGIVKSPTFSLLETYNFVGVNLYHYDLYRMKDPHELEYLGIRDLSAEVDAISLIEWPQRGGEGVPQADLVIGLEYQGDYREVGCHAKSMQGQAIIDQL
jgi:tRNA threonylcarbamoyladenosine biosynthesis protein TsaE